MKTWAVAVPDRSDATSSAVSGKVLDMVKPVKDRAL
jgi:hypothetical protein